MSGLEFENYHCHSYDSNTLALPDSPVSYTEYARVYQDRGMHCLFSTEHGNRGNIFEIHRITESLGKDYHMTPIAAVEAYFVPDRTVKDRTNAHLVLVARNQEGFYQLNSILSESYETGMYGRNRIDFDLLSRLDPSLFICTTACVAGPVRRFGSESEDICKRLASIFGRNFYLEVQSHLAPSQVEHNRAVLNLYRKYGWPLIYATDSHYILRSDKYKRDELIASSGIHYDDEDGFELFLPTADEAYEMLKSQGVLSEAQIREAFENTLMFRDFEGVHFDHTKKIPNIYPSMTQEERDAMYRRLVLQRYDELYGDSDPSVKARELADIEETELRPVIDTHTTDYFLDVKEIVDRGQKKGGILTHSGRGSGVSFASNHLLGFTSINRLRCPVQLWPERFISRERMEAGTIPDLDLNISNLEAFEEAGKEVCGEYGFLPMITPGKIRLKTAFKMLCRVENIDPQIANSVSRQIEEYEKALKYAEDDDRDEIRVEDYVGKEYWDILSRCDDYMGISVSMSPHACGHVMVDGDIRRLFGTIRLKAQSGKEPLTAAYISGDMADLYGWVKLDLLRVDCVTLINECYRRAGVDIPSVSQLIEMTKNDPAVWSLYASGRTLGLNQIEKENTTRRASMYRPRNIVELSCFIAAIRPGFKSMLDTYIRREKFSYGIPRLDSLLQSNGIDGSYLIFQEQIMRIVHEGGISPADGYVLIKAISKKKESVIERFHGQFAEGFSKVLIEQDGSTPEAAKETVDKIWQIIRDSAQYMFNASHAFSVACDSLYEAYIKAHYPIHFYTALLSVYAQKKKKDKITLARIEMAQVGITLEPSKFGQDNRGFSCQPDQNTISDSLMSCKFMSPAVAEDLYDMRTEFFPYFIDVLAYIEEHGICDSKQMKALIKMNYFSAYGGNLKLLNLYDEFANGKHRYKKSHTTKTKEERLEKLYELEEVLPDEKLTLGDQLAFEARYFSAPFTVDKAARDIYVVMDAKESRSVRVRLYCVSNGHTGFMRVSKNLFVETGMEVGDVIYTLWEKRPAYAFTNGKVTRIPNATEIWMNAPHIVQKHE